MSRNRLKRWTTGAAWPLGLAFYAFVLMPAGFRYWDKALQGLAVLACIAGLIAAAYVVTGRLGDSH